MAKTSKSCWSGRERQIARTDWNSERTPLSGENSRHGGGDVILLKSADHIVEVKLRAGFVHHTLFKAAQADAKKHKKKYAILYTCKKFEDGWLVTISGELFTQLLQIPEVRKLLPGMEPSNDA